MIAEWKGTRRWFLWRQEVSEPAGGSDLEVLTWRLDSLKPAGGFNMDWKLHLLTSFLVYFGLMLFFRFPSDYGVAAFILLALSSLLPDVDHPKSIIRGIIFAIIFYLFMLFVVMQSSIDLQMKILVIVIMLILTYYSYRNIPLKHRGRRSLHLWRYSFVSTGISAVIFRMANINISLVLFIFIGYALHLLVDKIKKF